MLSAFAAKHSVLALYPMHIMCIVLRPSFWLVLGFFYFKGEQTRLRGPG